MAVGIIAEFNPFHNGHKYLLQTAKKITGEPVVTIMSGSFVQRGGIAITDKLTRTRAALLGGADLVIELPVPFSHNTAQKFAMGAVATLKSCGIIDTLAFGSETGDKLGISTAARIIANEPKEVSDKIKAHMDCGISYPTARKNAYEGYFDTTLLSSPNDILAVEYMRASEILKVNFNPLPIKRIGTAHDSDEVTGTIASATEIRRRVMSENDFDSFTPYSDFDVYNPQFLDTAIISNLRLMPTEQLRNISEIGEGLENKFKAAARSASTVDELISSVKSKRYTLSRIRRIVYSSLIGLSKDTANLSPTYIRILGANENGRALLKTMKKTSTLPIITKPASYKGDAVFDMNLRAEDIFALCAPNNSQKTAGNDLRYTPIMNI